MQCNLNEYQSHWNRIRQTKTETNKNLNRNEKPMSLQFYSPLIIAKSAVKSYSNMSCQSAMISNLFQSENSVWSPGYLFLSVFKSDQLKNRTWNPEMKKKFSWWSSSKPCQQLCWVFVCKFKNQICVTHSFNSKSFFSHFMFEKQFWLNFVNTKTHSRV